MTSKEQSKEELVREISKVMDAEPQPSHPATLLGLRVSLVQVISNEQGEVAQ
jgi:hypothetical protein